MIKITKDQPIGEVINNQIQWNLEHTIPHPTECKITKIYEDNLHVDIKTNLYGELTYILTVGKIPCLDGEGVLIFLNNNYAERRVII